MTSLTEGRTMRLTRLIKAPVSLVWASWMNAEHLPKWWGPDGYSCRTKRIDLRQGGEWVFDMIAPDGTVFPNHHQYTLVQTEARIDYTLLRGENGPKHADASITFEDNGGATTVNLSMIMSSQDDFDNAMRFGARELGLQTLGKLARFIGAA